MTDVNSMKGKRAIVTGGGTGLGAATAIGPRQARGQSLHQLQFERATRPTTSSPNAASSASMRSP